MVFIDNLVIVEIRKGDDLLHCMFVKYPHFQDVLKKLYTPEFLEEVNIQTPNTLNSPKKYTAGEFNITVERSTFHIIWVHYGSMNSFEANGYRIQKEPFNPTMFLKGIEQQEVNSHQQTFVYNWKYLSLTEYMQAYEDKRYFFTKKDKLE